MMIMLLLVILIVSTSIYTLVERVYEGREKTNESIVGFINKVCEMELEPFISYYEKLAVLTLTNRK